MSILTIPNTFVTGAVIQAAPFNANFTAIQTWSSNIDNTNLGALGIYASQIIPTTGAQATFGSSLNYSFLGAVIAGSATAPGVNAGDLAASYSTTIGHIQMGGSSTSGTLSFNDPSVLNPAGGAFGFSKPLGCIVGGGSTYSYVPPCYTAAGAAVASTAHIVIGSFVGTGAGVNITLSGAAAFSSQFSYNIYGTTYFTASGSLAAVQGFNQVSGTLITCESGATTTTTTWIAIGT